MSNQKHIGFSDSIVMRELEIIARKQNLIEFEEKKPEIKAEASHELKETGDVFVDAISLARSLRERGFNKQAGLLERRALELKKVSSEPDDDEDSAKYNWWQETGDSLLEHAHKNDFHEPVPSSNDYGVVEDEIGAHKKIMRTIEHQPTGNISSASKKKIIDEINKLAQEEPSDPQWDTMKDGASKIASYGKSIVETIKSKIHYSGININSLASNKAALGVFQKTTGINTDTVLKFNKLVKNPTLMKIVSGGDAGVFFIPDNLDGGQPAIKGGYSNLGVACNDLGIKLNNTIVEQVNIAKKTIESYSKISSVEKKREGQIKLKSAKNTAMKYFTTIYSEVQKQYVEIENSINPYLKGEAVRLARSTILSAGSKFELSFSNIDQMVTKQLRFESEKFDNTLNNSENSANNIVSSIDSVKPLFDVSDKAEEFSTVTTSIKNDIAYFSKIVSNTKNALYKYDSFDKELRLIPADIGVKINELKDSVLSMTQGWTDLFKASRSVLHKLTDDQKTRLENEVRLGKLLYSSFKNADESKPYVYFYRSLPGEVSISKDPNQLAATVAKWQSELANSQKYIAGLKTASNDPDMTKLGFGGGLGGGAAPAAKTPSGGGTYTGGGKVSPSTNKTKKYVAMMQKTCGIFAEYMARRSTDPELKELALSSLKTSKQQAPGANADGIWGNNTKIALDAVSAYIKADPTFKSSSLNISSDVPGNEGEEATISRAADNTNSMHKALALAGNNAYKKYLGVGDLVFDRVPRTISSRDLAEYEGGIPLKRNHLSSLYVLKKYLEANDFQTTIVKG